LVEKEKYDAEEGGRKLVWGGNLFEEKPLLELKRI
jgi:hypothetical protein